YQSDWPPFVYLADGGNYTAQYTTYETVGTLNVPVRLHEVSGITATVDYSTADGSAVAGEDYTAVSGTLTFNPTETEKQITIPILTDGIADTDETFTITLSNEDHCVLDGLLPNNGVVTLYDDLAVSFVADTGLAFEDQGTATLGVQLSRAMGYDITVDYTSSDGTATAGEDYTATSGTVIFTAGTTQQSILVPLSSDNEVEDDETFIVNLSNPIGAPLGMPSEFAVTILDDDLPRVYNARIVHAEADLVHLAWETASGTSTVEVLRRDADLAGAWEPLVTVGTLGLWRDFGVEPEVRYEYRLVAYDGGGIAGREALLTLAVALPADDRADTLVVPGLASVVAGDLPASAHPFAGPHDYVFHLTPDPGPEFVACTVDVYVDEAPAAPEPDEPSQAWTAPYDGLARDELGCAGVAGTAVVAGQACVGPVCNVVVPNLTAGPHRFRFVLTDGSGKTSERAIVQDMHPWWQDNAGQTDDYPAPFPLLFSSRVNSPTPEIWLQGPTPIDPADSL
ncbi:MAG: hypothetical protein GY842_23090, partial [bacterium]|nr:hypothetical protein [bacterium]